jgi:hypothetical protein
MPSNPGRNIHHDSPALTIHSPNACGMFSCAIRKLNRTAFLMVYRSIADMLADCSSTLGTSASVMSF